MSFRTRLALVAAAAVALAVVLASVVVYVVVRNQLRSQFDNNLRDVAVEISHGAHPDHGPGGQLFIDPGPFVGTAGYIQAVTATGGVLKTFREKGSLPVTRRAVTAARGESDAYLSDGEIAGVRVRPACLPPRRSLTRGYPRSGWTGRARTPASSDDRLPGRSLDSQSHPERT